MSTLDNPPGAGTSWAVYLAASIPILLYLYNWLGPRSLRHIPTVGGPSLPLLSYVGSFNSVRHARAILLEGYEKYKGGVFKVSTLDRWLVVITGTKMIEELNRMPEEMVSFNEAAGQFSSLKYTIGREADQNPYHVTVIQGHLTRQLHVLFPEARDEIAAAFGDIIPPSNDWTKVNVLVVMREIVARTSNRIFIGLPTCRDKGYLKLAINFTMDVAKDRILLGFFPSFLKPLAARIISNLNNRIDVCIDYLRDKVEERLHEMRTRGASWTEKPNDMLQWMIDEEMKTGAFDIRNLARLTLLINFAAIHTTSNSSTHAIYHLAASPEIVAELREEVEAVLETDGWTKSAMGKMRKLDSFMRESQRTNGINSISLMRTAMQDIRFSDGTFIPAGTTLAASAVSTHMDEDNLANPEVFDPWRYSRMRSNDEGVTKHQLINTSPDYIAFGLGKHSCPGRFFAANEMKAMMAHIIVNYDIKFEQEGVRPANKWFGLAILPDPSGRVLFRKRRA